MSTSNSISEPVRLKYGRRNVMEHVFKLFDDDGDGKLSTNELCDLLSCFGILIDNCDIARLLSGDHVGLEMLNEGDWDCLPHDISKILQVLDDGEGDCLSDLRKKSLTDLQLIASCVTWHKMAISSCRLPLSDCVNGPEFAKLQMNISIPSPLIPSYEPVKGPQFATLETNAKLERVFSQFDKNGDGKLSLVEIQQCLGILHIDTADQSKILEFFEFDTEGKIEICKILKIFDTNIGFKQMYPPSPKNDHVAIDLAHLYSHSPYVDDNSIISKMRDIFLGLTGQAAVSFIAYAPMVSSSASPGRPLDVIVAANGAAFLFLLLSSGFHGKKLKTAERITGAIGIVAAAAVFFLMMGMFFPGRN